MNYKTIKQNYIKGLWTLPALKQAYRAGLITFEQYKEIKASKED